LAPVELVLWLPILLMVMALMVIFGNAAVWKLRTAAATRNALWAIRAPRTGQNDPPASNFSQTGTTQSGEYDPLAQLADPRIDRPVVRGPMLDQIRVDRDLLDPTRGMLYASGSMARDYPMLGKMGDYRYELTYTLLDDPFRYWEMEIPANRFRRIPFIYELPKADASYKEKFAYAVQEVVTAPFRRDLRPLDRDEEIRAYYGDYVDFHERVRPFCETDREKVRSDEGEDLFDRVQGRRRPSIPSVAEDMTQFWINMYQSMLGNPALSLSGGQQSAIQNSLTQLQEFMTFLRAERQSRPR
jgi:hypothetical protein